MHAKAQLMVRAWRMCGADSFTKGDMDTAAQDAGRAGGLLLPHLLQALPRPRHAAHGPDVRTTVPQNDLIEIPSPWQGDGAVLQCCPYKQTPQHLCTGCIVPQSQQGCLPECRWWSWYVLHVRRYERRYIERWLAGGSASCPCTGTSLTPPVPLTPNVALRKSIEVWAEKHARWLLVRGASVALQATT